eukprot:4277298-Pyramimonas_sp.AAC.1
MHDITHPLPAARLPSPTNTFALQRLCPWRRDSKDSSDNCSGPPGFSAPVSERIGTRKSTRGHQGAES